MGVKHIIPFESIDDVIGDLQNADITPPLEVFPSDINGYEVRSRITTEEDRTKFPERFLRELPSVSLYVLLHVSDSFHAVPVPAGRSYLGDDSDRLHAIHHAQDVIEGVLKRYDQQLEMVEQKPILTRVLDKLGFY